VYARYSIVISWYFFKKGFPRPGLPCLINGFRERFRSHGFTWVFCARFSLPKCIQPNSCGVSSCPAHVRLTPQRFYRSAHRQHTIHRSHPPAGHTASLCRTAIPTRSPFTSPCTGQIIREKICRLTARHKIAESTIAGDLQCRCASNTLQPALQIIEIY